MMSIQIIVQQGLKVLGGTEHAIIPIWMDSIWGEHRPATQMELIGKVEKERIIPIK